MRAAKSGTKRHETGRDTDFGTGRGIIGQNLAYCTKNQVCCPAMSAPISSLAVVSSTHPLPLASQSSPALVQTLPGRVAAGFPSPAEDHAVHRIDLMAELIRHPQATFLLRVKGDSMREVGIFDGDVVLVDRAIRPRSGQVVIAVVDGEFVCKTLLMRAGRVRLKAANPTFADIEPRDGQSLDIWGVVVAAIKQFRV